MEHLQERRQAEALDDSPGHVTDLRLDRLEDILGRQGFPQIGQEWEEVIGEP